MDAKLEQKARDLAQRLRDAANLPDHGGWRQVLMACGHDAELLARALQAQPAEGGVDGWNEDGPIYIDEDSGSLHIDLQNGGTERQFSLIAQRRGSVKFAIYVAGEGSWHGDVNDASFIPALRAYAAPKPATTTGEGV